MFCDCFDKKLACFKFACQKGRKFYASFVVFPFPHLFQSLSKRKVYSMSMLSAINLSKVHSMSMLNASVALQTACLSCKDVAENHNIPFEDSLLILCQQLCSQSYLFLGSML